jgi:alcohol dehydrogenase
VTKEEGGGAGELEKMEFTFSSPGKLVYGKGAIQKAGEEISAVGGKRVMLVTDEGLSSSPVVVSVKEMLGTSLAAVFDTVVPDSGIEVVNEGAAVARKHGVDSIVSVGGGSPMDTAKGIAVLIVKQSDDISGHLGFFTVGADVVPHVAIPTTAGTGSECTAVAVIKDRKEGVKRFVLDNHIVPRVAILDPETLVTLPPGLTASTGMDAMTHAVEAMVSTMHMPPADALAAHAISLLMEYLPGAVAKGDDLEARGNTLVASHLAGRAFQNTGVGVTHSVAHALGGKFGVPHGVGNALLLAPCMEYNIPAAAPRLAAVARAMGIPPSGDDEADARAAVEKMGEFNRKIGLDRRLSDVGVKEEGLEECAALAMADACLMTNPRKPEGPQELLEVYRKIL